MSMVVGETTGRYEPDSKYGKPKQSRETTKSHFKLEWEEGTLRLDERLAAWKIEPTPEDRPAGVARKDMRPIHSSDPTIFQHAEYPPATSRPSTASRISDTNKYFIQAVEGIAIDAGVAGDTARTLAIHHVFGSKMKRPPTAPGNIVSGKSQPAKPPPTPRPRTAGSARTGASTPRSEAKSTLPSRYCLPSKKVVQRSQSFDFVRQNKRNAPLTPRFRPPGPPPSTWKMSKFGPAGVERARQRAAERAAKPTPVLPQ